MDQMWGLNKASRIDLAFVSGGIDQKTKNVTYIPGVMTDHRALYLCLDLSLNERGAGFWKFNVKLLKNTDFLQHMNNELVTSIKSTENKQPQQIWEILKTRIKKVSKEFSKRMASEEKVVIGNLSEKVDEYESRLPLTQQENEILQDTKRDLEEKLRSRAEGILFRSKVQWYEEGERNTKYFFSLEKVRYNAKTCYKLINDAGIEVQKSDQILREQHAYYQNLYARDEHVNFNLTNGTDIRVPKEIEEAQNQQLSLSDIETAMLKMKNNKTPGEDGIPVDFYKVFWKCLKHPFYNAVLDSYEKQMMYTSARKGILNLIPKAGRDSRYIKNLRPITLLNADYKIIEKAIADKMVPALEYIINKDQRGFMKDRRISVNIRKMLDIMYYAEKEDLEAVVLSLDFVKCFDKCSFSILHGSLEFFGFGQIVKDWTKILYKEFEVRIQNNGHFSTSIPIEKGVHQGGCCSSVYFLVIAEILALALRGNEKIKGITIADIKNILNQFADDMDVFSENDENSIKEIYNQLHLFHMQSGFSVSYEKTTLYRIGSLRYSNAALYDLTQYKWSKEDINVLGVTIAHEDIVQKNYMGIQEKVKKVLGAWYNRGLSLIGKIQVVNTLVASLFVYKMMVLPIIPKNVQKCVENEIRNFIWGGKKAKIAFGILQNSKEEGGLGLVNLKEKDKCLKTSWPLILVKEQDYADIVYKLMKVSGISHDIWRCSLKQEHIKDLKVQNQFWSDVLESWCEYNYYRDSRIENQLIWYNSQILIKGKVFMWKDVHDRGLRYVHQLFEEKCYKTEGRVWEQYGLTVLRFNSLKTAIPKYFKTYFQENEKAQYMPLPPHNLDRMIAIPKSNLFKEIYKVNSSDVLRIHNKYLKWKGEINMADGLIDFGNRHKEIYKLTNVPKYRSFQYRLLQRSLVTNVELKRWNIIESEECTFCRGAKETIIHLMCECGVVRELWRKLQEYCTNKYNVQPKIVNELIVFNRLVEPKYHVINFICLITKQYIYAQKCQGKPLKFEGLVNKVNCIQDIEKYIARKNDKMSIHNKKWLIKQNVNSEQSLNEYVENYINNI